MKNDDLKQVGDEFVKLLELVYNQLDRIENNQKEHTDKIEALTGDVIGLQTTVGALKDKIINLEEKIDNHISEDRIEHDDIRSDLGLPLPVRNTAS